MTQIKFNKDQIQKMVLSALGFIVLVYVYFNFFLGPLNRSRAAMERSIGDLQQKIGTSNSEMARAKNLESEAGSATARYAALQALSPEGAPIAWFPPRMKSFFANEKIDKAVAKPEANGVAASFKQPELADWGNYTWQIEVPQVDFNALGRAIAALENSEPLLSITKLNLKSGTDDAQYQQATLFVSDAIIKR